MKKQKPYTKTERRNVRENTYHVVEPRACGGCGFCWTSRGGGLVCLAVALRGKLVEMPVDLHGTCDLFEKRVPR